MILGVIHFISDSQTYKGRTSNLLFTSVALVVPNYFIVLY